MPTRSGRTSSVGETSAPMDPNIHDRLNTLIDEIEEMDQQLQEVRDQVDVNCRDLATRLDRLEINRRRATEEENSRNGSRSPGENEFNPTIQLMLIPSILRALKSMLLPSMGAWTLRFI